MESWPMHQGPRGPEEEQGICVEDDDKFEG